MKAVYNVRDLVVHMIRVGEAQYNGTKYADDWAFYHDSLSLMTSNENLEWMKNRGYINRWTLPMEDLLAAPQDTVGPDC